MGLFDKIAKKAIGQAMGQAMEIAGSLTGAVNDAQQIADGVDAIGTVAEVPAIGANASSYVQPIALVVEVPGEAPYAARPTTSFTRHQIPTKGQRLPLRVSASDPTKIVVLWDQVASGLEEALSAARSDAADTGDVVAELERLAKLRDSGALTDEEFTTLKGRLLGA